MIIGLSGQAGSGKDTVADYLVAKHNFIQLSFAKVLKDGMSSLFGMTQQQLNDPKEKEQIDKRWGKTPRELMQWLGTDILRQHIRNDFFIIQVEDLIHKYKGKNIVISDARFPDECNMIWKLNGVIIKIIRPGHTGTKTKHISENLKIKADFEINNNQDKLNLYHKVELLIKNIEAKSIDNQC